MNSDLFPFFLTPRLTLWQFLEGTKYALKTLFKSTLWLGTDNVRSFAWKDYIWYTTRRSRLPPPPVRMDRKHTSERHFLMWPQSMPSRASGGRSQHTTTWKERNLLVTNWSMNCPTAQDSSMGDDKSGPGQPHRKGSVFYFKILCKFKTKKL